LLNLSVAESFFHSETENCDEDVELCIPQGSLAPTVIFVDADAIIGAMALLGVQPIDFCKMPYMVIKSPAIALFGLMILKYLMVLYLFYC